MNFRIEPLNSSFNKKELKCGKEMLDTYLHKQASQDLKRRLSTAKAFYARYDFIQLNSGKMFLAMLTIAALFKT